MPSNKEIARVNLGIKPQNKIILSLDGGGMRGIFTIQLLKKLEELAGSPCYEWIDMIAGTSTGTLIGSLILKKNTAAQIEEYYVQLVSRVFTKRNVLANRFYNPPAFDKKNFRTLVKSIIGDVTLRDVNAETGIDILFTSKDISAGEETFFTCFNNSDAIKGTYQTALLRGVMEATMSAPTYFASFERFVDGGTTTFNNPVGAAVLEALTYDGAGKYKQNELTIFSLGTAAVLRFIEPQKTNNPKGLDAIFWLNYVMDEASKDASEMQVDTMRSGLIAGLDFRRYQLSLDTTAVRKLPDMKIEHVHDVAANWIHQLTDEDLASIDMADVTKFSLMKVLGEAVAAYICPLDEATLPMVNRKANWFQRDMVSPYARRGDLVTAKGDVAAIKSHLANAQWIDEQFTK